MKVKKCIGPSVVKVDIEKFKEGLAKYSREPFQDFLRTALTNAPSPQSISIMAENNPLQWATYTEKIAKLYGYTDSHQVNHTHRVIHEMTSEQIDAEIAQLDRAALDIDQKDIKQLE